MGWAPGPVRGRFQHSLFSRMRYQGQRVGCTKLGVLHRQQVSGIANKWLILQTSECIDVPSLYTVIINIFAHIISQAIVHINNLTYAIYWISNLAEVRLPINLKGFSNLSIEVMEYGSISNSFLGKVRSKEAYFKSN